MGLYCLLTIPAAVLLLLAYCLCRTAKVAGEATVMRRGYQPVTAPDKSRPPKGHQPPAPQCPPHYHCWSAEGRKQCGGCDEWMRRYRESDGR